MWSTWLPIWLTLTPFLSSLNGSHMWYLIEDFFEQSLVMKAVLGWGWLCILIMVTSVLL